MVKIVLRGRFRARRTRTRRPPQGYQGQASWKSCKLERAANYELGAASWRRELGAASWELRSASELRAACQNGMVNCK